MVSRWLRRVAGRPAGPRIFLHIGAMKTGTTFLQGLMDANRGALRDAGVVFPGERWWDQSMAVREILWPPADARMRDLLAGHWDRISREMLDHPGTSVLSMEFLSFADTEQARRVLDSLEGAEVHVVLTVRDANASIPGQWQTSCRNGGRISYQRMVRAVRYVLNDELPPQGKSARLFQRTQGIPQMLDVWVPLVGARHVHVVTVPPRGTDPMVLWRRFAGVVGVDPAVCTELPEDANPSLGHASSELLRRINAGLGTFHRIDYNRIIKGRLARRVLAARSDLEQTVVLNRRGRTLAARWNRSVREAIASQGVELVGSFDDLPVEPGGPDDPQDLPAPSAEELIAAAVTARDGLANIRERLSARVGGPAPEPLPDLPTPADRWSSEPDPVAAAVEEVTALARVCVDLRHRIPDKKGGWGPADDDFDDEQDDDLDGTGLDATGLDGDLDDESD